MVLSWAQVIAELTLARSESQFALALEQATCERLGASWALYLDAHRSQESLRSPAHGLSLPLSETTLAGACALYCEPLIQESTGLEEYPGPACAVPVRLFGSLVGVLLAGDLSDPGPLEELAAVSALALDAVVRREDEQRLESASQEMLIQALESLPGYPRGHVTRVARLSSELAAQLDLSARTRETLFQAALYHDVGILRLADRDREEQRSGHPEAGAAYLRSCQALEALAPLVESHHERYDGSGIPQGRRGETLPLESWVLSLAEHAVEYWGSSRSYQEGMLGFFSQEASKHHPEVVEALMALADKGRLEAVLS